MNDAELTAMWSSLEPAARRRAQIESHVFEWIEAQETSLASEWLGLLKVDPMAFAYVAAGAVSLVLLTPLGWVTAWLLG